MCELICAAVQRLVGQFFLLEDRSDSPGRNLNPGLEELVNALFVRLSLQLYFTIVRRALFSADKIREEFLEVNTSVTR